VELQWRSHFGWGRKWGGETWSRGDERGSDADSFCHGRGKGCCTGEVSRRRQCSAGRRWVRSRWKKKKGAGAPWAGVAGWAECHLGRHGEKKEKSGMGRKDDWAEMILACAEKKRKMFSDFDSRSDIQI
jgi:hypothetical protein